jgi:single-strand DNA-binding protein
MSDINQVTIFGRLTRDPEVRVVPTGTTVASFSIATNRVYQDKGGQWKEEAAFVPCVSFGRTAEQLGQRQKGAALLVTGRLRTDSWTKNGENQSRLQLVVDTIHLILPVPKNNAAALDEQALALTQEIRKAVPF